MHDSSEKLGILYSALFAYVVAKDHLALPNILSVFRICNVIDLHVITEQPLDLPSLDPQLAHIVITSYQIFLVAVWRPRLARQDIYLTPSWCQLLLPPVSCCLFVNISVESV